MVWRMVAGDTTFISGPRLHAEDRNTIDNTSGMLLNGLIKRCIFNPGAKPDYIVFLNVDKEIERIEKGYIAERMKPGKRRYRH